MHNGACERPHILIVHPEQAIKTAAASPKETPNAAPISIPPVCNPHACQIPGATTEVVGIF